MGRGEEIFLNGILSWNNLSLRIGSSSGSTGQGNLIPFGAGLRWCTKARGRLLPWVVEYWAFSTGTARG